LEDEETFTSLKNFWHLSEKETPEI
jgi:hypothetical protein